MQVALWKENPFRELWKDYAFAELPILYFEEEFSLPRAICITGRNFLPAGISQDLPVAINYIVPWQPSLPLTHPAAFFKGN